MDATFIYSNDLPFNISDLAEELELLGLTFNSIKMPDESSIKSTIDDFKNNKLPDNPDSISFILSGNSLQKILSSNITFTTHDKVLFFAKNLSDNEHTHFSGLIKGIVNLKRQSLSHTAVDIVRELSEPQRGICFLHDKANIWKSPLYIFRRIQGYDNIIETLIDVTWSARPTKPYDLPDSLTEFFRKAITHIGKSQLRILDFGAGKLRYTLFLLKKGHTVKAVDFKSLYTTPEEKKFISEAEGYGAQFEQVEYPVSFSQLTQTFDLVLLINVLNVMPEPLERHFVLYECNRKLRDGGYVLWFCQYGDQDQKNRVKDNPITDGGYTLNNRGRSTFYKDYNSKSEIDRLMALHGFEREEVKHAVSGNHALLYKKTKPPLVDMGSIITNERQYILGRKVTTGKNDSNIAIADIIDGEKFVRFGDLLKFQFSYLNSGNKDAYKFEDLAVEAIKYIFQKDFSGLDFQYNIDEKRQRVDIKGNWASNSELKQKIVVDMNIESSWVPIECKNYTPDPGNPEFAQLVDRCNAKFRRFGLLICRKIRNKATVLAHCHRRLTEHNYLLIVLDADDLAPLLSLADDEQFTQIADVMVQKIADVTDRRM